jgi:hypothetical protein
MRQFVKTSVATAVMTAALVAAGSVSAGSIANTKHNLGATGTGNNRTASTEEICIFCHTPHGGDIDAPVPLWNKQLSSPDAFTTYDQLGTTTLDAGVGMVGSVSLACLTCHDGTQAIDNIRNAPGSGGFLADGGGPDGLEWLWESDNSSLDAVGRFQNSVDGGGGIITNLGTDLRNDHPVSMQYGGGGYSATNPTGGGFGATGPNGTRDHDFAAAVQVGTSNRWYIDNVTMDGVLGSALGTFDVWDFKLYTRDTTGLETQNSLNGSPNGGDFALEPEPFVECGSCHDPHLETDTFLRIDASGNPAGDMSNSGSAICLACHLK